MENFGLHIRFTKVGSVYNYFFYCALLQFIMLVVPETAL